METEVLSSSTLGCEPAADPDRRLRVLFTTARYLPLVGGTEMHTYEVARRLAAHGHDVTILTTDRSGELSATEEVQGVRIIRVRAWPANRDWYFAPDVFRVIAGGNWDIVHCQGYHTLVAPFAMAASWHMKIPYVVSFHSGGHSSRLRNALRGAQRTLLRPLLAHASHFVCVSEFEAGYFPIHLRLPEERFSIIPNGSNPLPATETVPRQYQDVADAPLIVSVGRLERYKGHQRILAAMPKVLEQYPNARLRIVGTGPYEETLRRMAQKCMIADHVDIEGIAAADRTAMGDLLSRAALVTLLSDYEAHPISAMEALSLRRPMLVADTSGLSELGARGLARAIPLNSTSDQVANAVLDQLREPLVPVEVTVNDWESCADSLAALYHVILERK